MYAWFYFWDLYSTTLIYLSLLSSVLNCHDYSRSGNVSPSNLLFSFNIILDLRINHKYFVAQLLSCIQLFATPRTAAWQASLSFTISWNLLKLMSIKSVMPSNHLILCHPLLLLHSIFPSIRIFCSESALCIRWPKYWSFSFSISSSSEYSGLISFRVDWFDLPVAQGTLKSLLQYHSSKASILQCWAFYMVQLSHPYMTTGKTIALTRWMYVGQVISLVFNMHVSIITVISSSVLCKV